MGESTRPGKEDQGQKPEQGTVKKYQVDWEGVKNFGGLEGLIGFKGLSGGIINPPEETFTYPTVFEIERYWKECSINPHHLLLTQEQVANLTQGEMWAVKRIMKSTKIPLTEHGSASNLDDKGDLDIRGEGGYTESE